METHARFSVGKLALWIALFVALGTPLVAYLWETLNKVMAGHFELLRIAIAVPLLVLFVVLIRFLARFVTRVEAERFE